MSEVSAEAIHNFEDFYTRKIEPLVDEYKAKGNAYGSWGSILIFFLLVFIVSLVIFFQADGSGFFCFLAFLLLVFSIYKYVKAQDTFRGDFKNLIIKAIIDFILPENEYKPDSFISTRLFKASCLYRNRVNDIQGDDYLKGNYKNVPFQASELRTSDDDDARNREWKLFRGLFFAADIGRFAGGTYIWRNDNIQTGNSIADERYRLFPIPTIYRIRTGSEQFNKHYTVYSTYPAEAHSILTDDMMQNILSFRQQLNRDITLSFVAGRCYVAIPFDEQLLEPVHDLTDKEGIKRYFFTILLYPAIINQLKLYEYI